MKVVSQRFHLVILLALSLAGGVASAQDGPKADAPAELPGVFKKRAPETVEDLRTIQEHTAKLVDRIMPSVVCVRVGPAFGSGVIVTKDGYVLTAGHVSGKPDREVVFYFHNGKTAKGKTLGGNHGIDSGLMKITSDAPEGGWPVSEMADSAKAKTGDWCLVCAHPGGFKTGRTPPVRLGRLLKATSTTLTTDCILVGGDSGGPLFDMHGHVLGINSRIGPSLAANMHVPVNPYRESWDKMAKAEVWGGKLGGKAPLPAKGSPFLGVQTMPKENGGVLIVAVTPNSPAEKAGLKADDIIMKFDNKAITADTPLGSLVLMRKVGDLIVLEVLRGDETLRLKLEIGKR